MANQVKISINNKNYTNFIGFVLTRDLDNLCGECVLTTNPAASTVSGLLGVTDPTASTYFPIQVNDFVVITCDDEPLLTGYVTGARINTDSGQHKIEYTINDKTIDLIDNKLDARQFNGSITFIDLLKKVLTACDIEVGQTKSSKLFGPSIKDQNQIAIVNNAGDIEPFSASEKIKARSAESASNFITRYADKRQIVVNTNGNGDLEINKVASDECINIIKNTRGDGGRQNNLISANYEVDTRNRFYKYTFRSVHSQKKGSYISSSGVAYDKGVRKSRSVILIASSSLSNAECQVRAEWEANIRKMKSESYICQVVGFRQKPKSESLVGLTTNPTALVIKQKSPLWKINQIIKVQDDFVNLTEDMLIKKIIYKQDVASGSTTELILVNKKYYTESLNEPFIRRKKAATGSKEILYDPFANS